MVSKTDKKNMENLKINILLPAYNDWECLEQLIQKILNVLDGKVGQYPDVHLIDLTHIIGHQKTIAIGLFTDLAIPGWATYSILALLIIFIQTFFISIVLGFAVTFFRTYKVFIPAINYRNYLPINEQL